MSCADCDLTELCRCARLRMAKAGTLPACVALPEPVITLYELRRTRNVVLSGDGSAPIRHVGRREPQ